MQKINSSFRDPGSRVFTEEGTVYRWIKKSSVPHYQKLMSSGLYGQLVENKLLVRHEDVTKEMSGIVGAAADDVVIKPEQVPFISYPSEWSFSSLKAAALTTLKIQKICIEHDMSLQDASAFNVQFYQGNWVLIDTGSFYTPSEGAPWQAYRQFCQHFIAPLLLMTYCDVRLLSLLRFHLDGVPLKLASSLLPLRAKLRIPVLLHIVLHGRFADVDFSFEEVEKKKKQKITKASALGLIDQLYGLVKSLDIKDKKTAWTDYEETHSYQAPEFKEKEKFVVEAVKETPGVQSVWDLGANTGHFSRLIADSLPKQASVLALENDFMTVEAGDRKSGYVTGNKPLHLWMDLMNPTPNAGWEESEWPGLVSRGPADMVLALALVHHLCLTGNVSFEMLATFLKNIARRVVIEFVPKDDPQAQRLLKVKEDIFTEYTQEAFETAIKVHFDILKKQDISSTGRVLYLLRRQER